VNAAQGLDRLGSWSTICASHTAWII